MPIFLYENNADKQMTDKLCRIYAIFSHRYSSTGNVPTYDLQLDRRYAIKSSYGGTKCSIFPLVLLY